MRYINNNSKQRLSHASGADDSLLDKNKRRSGTHIVLKHSNIMLKYSNGVFDLKARLPLSEGENFATLVAKKFFPVVLKFVLASATITGIVQALPSSSPPQVPQQVGIKQ